MHIFICVWGCEEGDFSNSVPYRARGSSSRDREGTHSHHILASTLDHEIIVGDGESKGGPGYVQELFRHRKMLSDLFGPLINLPGKGECGVGEEGIQSMSLKMVTPWTGTPNHVFMHMYTCTHVCICKI